MFNSLRKRILSILSILTITALAFSQTDMDYSSLKLYSSSLENGMEIFTVPDRSNACASIFMVFRNGFRDQTRETQGIFELYAELLNTSIPQEYRSLFRIGGFKAQMNQNCLMVQADIPPEKLGIFFSGLCRIFSSPEYSDSDMNRAISRFREGSREYEGSPAGFINRTIDSILFSEEPWKSQNTVPPSAYEKRSAGEMRQIVYSISRRWFGPENCSLFVSGNVSPREVEDDAARFFSSWRKEKQPDSPTPVQKLPKAENRKFVLASSQFSQDFTQMALYFDDLERRECDMVSMVLAKPQSELKSRLIQDPLLSIRSQEYANVQSVGSKSESHLVIQSLMEKPFSFGNRSLTFDMDSAEESPAAQAEKFITVAKRNSFISRNDLIMAQEESIMEYRKLCSCGKYITRAMAEYRPYASFDTLPQFYRNFQDNFYGIRAASEITMNKKISSCEPYVFVMMNRESYDRERESFEKAGYTLITEADEKWYEKWPEPELEKPQETVEESALTEGPLFRPDPAEWYYASTLRNTRSGVLSNGIPFTLRQNKGTQTVALSIAIQGGMFSSPATEKNLRSILVQAAAKNSGIAGIEYETRETHSTISFSLFKEDAEKSLRRFTDALILGEITPVKADRLFAEENYNALIKQADLGWQMKSNVFAYLYRNTPLRPYFIIDDGKSNSASYQSLLTGYTDLLDASLYSIVVVGDIDEKAARQYLEKSFGMLKNHSQRKEPQVLPRPEFKNRERNIQLRHLFKTDMSADLAPKESPILVPTKEFFDPVQIYFRSPDEEKQIDLFNALLLELKSRMQEITGESGPCTWTAADTNFPVGIIQGNRIKKASVFLKAYSTARNQLIAQLKDEEHGESAAETIREAAQIEMMKKTQSNLECAKLIQAGNVRGKPLSYIESYLYTSKASPEEFLQVLEKNIPPEPLMKVYSVDGKK